VVFSFALCALSLFNSVRKKRHRPSSLDGAGHHALVPGAIPGSARRNDLGLRIHKLSHEQCVFIIDRVNIITAKVARFFGSLNLLLVHVFH